jgi:hypothetical protein
MVPPVQQEEEEEEEDENDVPNEATTEQTIIPGGDVDQTFDDVWRRDACCPPW